MMFSFLPKKDQLGLTLLEVIVSLTILSAATIGLASLASRYSDETLVSVTASQVRTFGQASNAYIKENYAAIQAVATVTSPALINVGTLIAAGKLPAGYSAVDAKGHNLCTLVIQPTAARLQAVVVGEGGTPVNDLDLGALASTIGGSGGGVYSSAATVIRGAVGGWSVPTATFDNLVNNVGTNCAGVAGRVRVVTGTPVMALWFENGDTNAAFLARDPVPGRPELNVMNAALVLDSVQTAGAACTRLGSLGRDSTGALLACQAGLWRTQGSSFWQDAVPNFASLPTCNATNSGQTRVATTPTVGTGPRAYNCNGTSWSALAVDDNANITIAGTAFTGKIALTDTVSLGAVCTPNGLVSRDATGLTLSCQSGKWKALGAVISPIELSATSGNNFYVSGCYSPTTYLTIPTSGYYAVSIRSQAYRYSGSYTTLGAYLNNSTGGNVCFGIDNIPQGSGATYFTPQGSCIVHLDAGSAPFFTIGSDASACATSDLNMIFLIQATARLLQAD